MTNKRSNQPKSGVQPDKNKQTEQTNQNDRPASNQPMSDQQVSDQQVPDQQLSELQQALQQKDEAYRRALADYQNQRRQFEQEKARIIQFASLSMIEELLPTLDHLEMAVKHVADPAVQMVRDEFVRVLRQHGLEPIEIKPNSEFDHNLMEAIDTKPGSAGKVLEVVQTGYQLNGVVIRHAKVIVGKEK